MTASMCEQHRPRVGMQVRWDDPGREARFRLVPRAQPQGNADQDGRRGWSLASRSSQPESGGPSQRPSWCSSARCRRTSRSRSATCAATADRRDAAAKSDAAVPRDCERSPAMLAPPSRPLHTVIRSDAHGGAFISRTSAFTFEGSRKPAIAFARSGRHDPAGRLRRLRNQIRPRASLGRRQVGARALQTSPSRRGPRWPASRATPRLGDAPWRTVEPGSTLRRRAPAVAVAPAQREEARRQPDRSLDRLGSRLATGWTARQTWRRVLGSRRRRPSRP